MAETILCITCLMAEPPVETPGEVQIDGTLYCREHGTALASMPRMRARMGMMRPRPGTPQ